jgi:signal peptidase I
MAEAGGAPNPYAPGEAVVGAAAVQQGQRPSRGWAIAGSLAGFFTFQPFAGVGLFLLGRSRRAAVWTIATALLFVIAMVAGVAGSGRLWLAAFFVEVLVGLGAVVDTLVTAPGDRQPFTRPLAVVIVAAVAGLGLARAARAWLLESFIVPAGSGAPTLLVGDRILVSKRATRGEPGDMIVFEYPLDPSTDYVKRVVAVAGDAVGIRRGIVEVNGRPLPQRQLPRPCTPPVGPDCHVWEESSGTRRYTIQRWLDEDREPMTVRPGHVFVLGDNRDSSRDSREWGTVPIENIKGKVLSVWWSNDPERGTRADRIGLPVD